LGAIAEGLDAPQGIRLDGDLVKPWLIPLGVDEPVDKYNMPHQGGGFLSLQEKLGEGTRKQPLWSHDKPLHTGYLGVAVRPGASVEGHVGRVELDGGPGSGEGFVGEGEEFEEDAIGPGKLAHIQGGEVGIALLAELLHDAQVVAGEVAGSRVFDDASEENFALPAFFDQGADADGNQEAHIVGGHPALADDAVFVGGFVDEGLLVFLDEEAAADVLEQSTKCYLNHAGGIRITGPLG